jgi:hypothetical protein
MTNPFKMFIKPTEKPSDLKVGMVRIVTSGAHYGMPFVVKMIRVDSRGRKQALMKSYFDGGPSGFIDVEEVLRSTRPRHEH